jgi:hypothetical protein
MHRLFRLFLPILALVGLEVAATAQCPQPDGLDGGPCCALAQEHVPKIPKFQQDSLEICWRDCNVNALVNWRAVWSFPNIAMPGTTNCGTRTGRLDLLDAAGILQWSGQMRIIYSRTWMESTAAGSLNQVWRFLLNGDLTPQATAGPIPCPVPGCVPAFNGRARFTGYLDYAQECGTGVDQFAWMLSHVCDLIDHHAGFPRAGAFHPDRSYTFVGPRAGFVPSPFIAIEGTPGSPFEAVRRIQHPPPGTTGPLQCVFEERINHSLLPINQFCQCGAPGTNQWYLANLTIGGACGTTVTTPGGPLLAGYLSMSIGGWTLPAVFPGVEQLRWNAGNYNWADACSGVTTNDVFYGVTTLNGDPAFQVTSGGPISPLPLTFIDQANSIRTGGGAVMNIVYLADKIINLNH